MTTQSLESSNTDGFTGISQSDYYLQERLDIVQHIEKTEQVVLDVGCGEGNLGRYLKENGFAKKVVGIEYVPEVALRGQANLDKVICGDLEKIDFTAEELEPASFDLVICGDVLEHLIDPWSALHKLTEFVKPGGRILLSIPNIRYWKVSFPLVFKGQWRYQDSGILDRTHLRFFVKESILELISMPGMITVKFSQKGLEKKYGTLSWLANILSFGLLSDLFTYQYIAVLEKTSGK